VRGEAASSVVLTTARCLDQLCPWSTFSSRLRRRTGPSPPSSPPSGSGAAASLGALLARRRRGTACSRRARSATSRRLSGSPTPCSRRTCWTTRTLTTAARASRRAARQSCRLGSGACEGRPLTQPARRVVPLRRRHLRLHPRPARRLARAKHLLQPVHAHAVSPGHDGAPIPHAAGASHGVRARRRRKLSHARSFRASDRPWMENPEATLRRRTTGISPIRPRCALACSPSAVRHARRSFCTAPRRCSRRWARTASGQPRTATTSPGTRIRRASPTISGRSPTLCPKCLATCAR